MNPLLLAVLPILGWATEPDAVEPSDPLSGIWESELHFGPQIAGPLVLQRIDGEWLADLGGHRLPVDLDQPTLEFELPGDLGEFRGWRDGDHWRGHWLQPATEGLGQKLASPVTLSPGADGSWRGEIRPYPDRLILHFVFREHDGGWSGYLRNPDRNLGRILRITGVERSGDDLTLRGNVPWQKDEQVLGRGRYHADAQRITLTLLPFATAITLRRMPDDAQNRYRARAPGPIVYRPPTPLGDGWPTEDLASSGLDQARIRAFIEHLAGVRIESLESPDIHAVLIARHGRLVLEEYFHGYHRDHAHDTRSASKSLTTVLLGAAMEANLPIGLDRPMTPDPADPRHAITVEHLATMTSGLACNDWDGESPGGEDRMQNQSEQPDWYAYIRALPVVHPPGTHPAYCSGGISLVGQILAEATGIPLMRLFSERVAQPLGLGQYYLNLSPTDHPYMGGGIRWRARDFLKLGQLILDGGTWQGRRILSEDYARELIRPRHVLGSEGRYALGWWVKTYPFGDREVTAFFAGGNGGQILMGFPELDLLVLFYGGNYSTAATFAAQRRYIPEYILPAVKP